MNFDRDYQEFVEHLKQECVVRPVELSEREAVAVKLFVAYLNIRYKNARTPLTSQSTRPHKRRVI